MTVPAALYRGDMELTDKSRLQTADMRFLKSVLGVRKRDKLKNESIGNQLQICSIHEQMEYHRLNWFRIRITRILHDA